MAGEMASGVGRRIRQRREEMALKQRQLADLIDPTGAIDNQRVSDWERGVNHPSERYMAAIAKALERPVAWFYEDEAAGPGPTPELFGVTQLDRIEKALQGLTSQVAVLSSQIDEIRKRLPPPADEQVRQPA